MNKINTYFNKSLGSLFLSLSILAAPIASLVVPAQTAAARSPMFVAMTNSASANALVAYAPDGTLVGTFSTNGKGGAGGNAGAVQAQGDLVAVPDFGSNDVAIFQRTGNSFKLRNNITTAAAPVSVAFGGHHLYVLEANKVESFMFKGASA